MTGVSWLGPMLVTPAIIGAYLWIWTGFAMVLIGAGLSALPRDALEAARMDGANEWQIFRRITVPLLAPVLAVVFVTLVINVMKVFDLVYIIAPGPVQEDATVLATQMWLVSFGGGNNQGLGSALGVLLLLLVVPGHGSQHPTFPKESVDDHRRCAAPQRSTHGGVARQRLILAAAHRPGVAHAAGGAVPLLAAVHGGREREQRLVDGVHRARASCPSTTTRRC